LPGHAAANQVAAHLGRPETGHLARSAIINNVGCKSGSEAEASMIDDR